MVAITLVVFAPAIEGGFLNWDDQAVVTSNPHIRGLTADNLRWMVSGVHMGHYQPLTWLSYAVDFEVWGGLDAFGFRFTNVALHAANAGLVFALLLALLSCAAPGVPWPRVAALVGALFWSLHPLRVESVAWITERRDVLSGLFLLGSVCLYLRAHRARLARARAGGWVAAAVLVHALSLGAKAWGITLPVILLLLDGWPLGRFARGPNGERAWLGVVLEKVPFALLALGAAAMALHAQASVGALSTGGGWPSSQSFAQAIYGLSFYLESTVLPTGLSPLYERWIGGTELWPPAVVARAAALAAIAAGAVALAVRRRAPAPLVAGIAYLVVVSPVLGFAQSGPQVVADRYSYLAAVPLAALVAGAWQALARRPSGPRWPAIVAGAALVALASGAVLQARHWRNSISLWARAVEVDPDSARAWINLAGAFDHAGERAAALECLERADRASPGSWLVGVELVRYDKRYIPAAIAALDRAIASTPSRALLYTLRGQMRGEAGDTAGGIADLEQALRLAPHDALALYHRGALRAAAGDHAAALDDLDAALLARGGVPLSRSRALDQRGFVKARLGDLAGALADLDAALALAPGFASARLHRAEVHRERGDLAAARADVDVACEATDAPPEAYALRAALRRGEGDVAGARRDLESALARAPASWPRRAAVKADLEGLDDQP